MLRTVQGNQPPRRFADLFALSFAKSTFARLARFSGGGGAAFSAHVGGFLAGIVGVKLFARHDHVASHRTHHWRPAARRMAVRAGTAARCLMRTIGGCRPLKSSPSTR